MSRAKTKWKCLKNCGECCGIVEFHTDVWEAHKDKAVRKVMELMEIKRRWGYTVIPMTEDLKCPFLTSEKRCAIYESRPRICECYGVNVYLPCPYITPAGRRREAHEVQRVLRKIGQMDRMQLMRRFQAAEKW